MSDWCTIESDPGVFTALIESFGVKNSQLTELWSLDDDTLRVLLQSYGKIHGLVFLFKWQQNGSGSSDVNDDGKSGPLVGGDAPEDLFFARQVTTNACATQAILSILLNAKEAGNGDANDNSGVNVGMELGETLSNLKAFTSSFPPDLKGESIGASEEIRSAHNSFAKQEAFMMADEDRKRTAGKDDEVFHFVAYVPHHDGTVYELDGLQPGPIPVGTYTPDNENGNNDFPWLSTARAAIQKRIEKYQSSEIKFNLMALTADKRKVLQSKIQSAMEANITDDAEVTKLNMELIAEEELRENWKEENERRRHNYLPLCVELLMALGKSGTLQGCTRRANEKMTARARA